MIFISHRKADEREAIGVANYLKSKGIECWVDVLDPATKNKATDITKHIISTLNRCTHVIVLFSINTDGSMWVPFELGAAYKAEKGIGTYLLQNVRTPEYLDAFPRMRTSYDLDQYAEEYKKDQQLSKSSLNRGMVFNESNNADSFISRMKTRLRQ